MNFNYGSFLPASECYALYLKKGQFVGSDLSKSVLVNLYIRAMVTLYRIWSPDFEVENPNLIVQWSNVSCSRTSTEYCTIRTTRRLYRWAQQGQPPSISRRLCQFDLAYICVKQSAPQR